MGTTGRENPRPDGRVTPLDFQGPSSALRTPQKRGALPAERPLLRLTRFRGPPLSQGCQGEERTPPGATAGVSRFVYVAVVNPHSGAGILTGFPFG